MASSKREPLSDAVREQLSRRFPSATGTAVQLQADYLRTTLSTLLEIDEDLLDTMILTDKDLFLRAYDVAMGLHDRSRGPIRALVVGGKLELDHKDPLAVWRWTTSEGRPFWMRAGLWSVRVLPYTLNDVVKACRQVETGSFPVVEKDLTLIDSDKHNTAVRYLLRDGPLMVEVQIIHAPRPRDWARVHPWGETDRFGIRPDSKTDR